MRFAQMRKMRGRLGGGATSFPAPASNLVQTS
jgi:hypothetical protein